MGLPFVARASADNRANSSEGDNAAGILLTLTPGEGRGVAGAGNSQERRCSWERGRWGRVALPPSHTVGFSLVQAAWLCYFSSSFSFVYIEKREEGEKEPMSLIRIKEGKKGNSFGRGAVHFGSLPRSKRPISIYPLACVSLCARACACVGAGL